MKADLHQKKAEQLVELLREIPSQEDLGTEPIELFRERYGALSREERFVFFECLLRRIEVPREKIERALRDVVDDPGVDPVNWTRHLTRLRRSVESPRLRAFRRFVNLSGGLKFLLDLRADVLAAQRQSALDLEPLDEEIAHLFDSWFQHGFLFLQEITPDSPYRQIRFLKDHDLVHPMASLEEMGSRLGGDRRCFALYHRAMPEEPVVFIEAALTRSIVRSIHEILRDGEGSSSSGGSPDTAIFYSINNTQNGLAGLGLGKVLIFQVVDAIRRDHPEIKTFATLSPIPGFWTRYLKPILDGSDARLKIKRERVLSLFSDRARRGLTAQLVERTGRASGDFSAVLLEILSAPRWIEDAVYVKWLRKPLTALGYYYIAEEKNRQGRPLNPVASFHLGNGAMVSPGNVSFGAHRSERGLSESCGLMVNYIYSSTWAHQLRRSVRSLIPWQA